MHPALLTLLVGMLYLVGFGALSVMRHEGLSNRFLAEGSVITAAGSALAFVVPSLHPALFFVALYLATMRVRLLTDLGNLFTNRQDYDRALAIFRLALRLWPDGVGRRIVLINRGVAYLRKQDFEAAYQTLNEALSGVQERPGAKYLAAGYYNLGLACRQTHREAEAVRRFNEAIDTLPFSIYARGAEQALKKGHSTFEKGDEHG
ncbi:MAG: tetratricopeptide repeat protein [Anaerolineae bacterium]|nr:tetratricopeptide repeat protein [Anaerolineae bacterium]